MITHACVRYKDDLSQAIVPVNHIKDFKPTGPSDFVYSANYYVRWTNGDEESGEEEYYKARILLLGVSEEDVGVKMSKNRIRIKKIWASESSEDEVPERKQQSAKQEKKRMKERQDTAGRSGLLKLLEAKKKKMTSANTNLHVNEQPSRLDQAELEERHARDRRSIRDL
ncbi:hypothetical protein ISCGN_030065 [Ixodes scapularis]